MGDGEEFAQFVELGNQRYTLPKRKKAIPQNSINNKDKQISK